MFRTKMWEVPERKWGGTLFEGNGHEGDIMVRRGRGKPFLLYTKTSVIPKMKK